MSNFSFTIFGPEDGYKQFTVPNNGLIPEDAFKINPSDFYFKTGGKLLQVIKINDKIYLSLHQQVFQVNGERPGYTFGESIYFETSNLDSKLILRNIYELHAAFSHECLTENGRFDGFKFVNNYRSSQLTKYNILKDDFDSKLLKSPSQSSNKLFSNQKSAFYLIESLDDIESVHSVVSWMINSPGSMRYSRLLIIDNSSGAPSDDFLEIKNLDFESTFVFNSVYSAYLEYQNINEKLEKSKSDLLIDNNSLFSQNQELTLKLLNINKSANQTVNIHPAKSVTSHSTPDFSYVERSLEMVKSDVSRLKTSASKHQEDIALLSEDVSSSKNYSLITLSLSVVLILIIGILLFELNTISVKASNFEKSIQLLSFEQNKNFRELKNNLPNPNPNPNSSSTNGEGENTLPILSSKSTIKKENSKNK